MKQLDLGSLRNLEACLVSWLEMHFCKINQHVWEKILIEGGLHRRYHCIPLTSISLYKAPHRKLKILQCSLFRRIYICPHPIFKTIVSHVSASVISIAWLDYCIYTLTFFSPWGVCGMAKQGKLRYTCMLYDTRVKTKIAYSLKPPVIQILETFSPTLCIPESRSRS